MRRNFMLAFQLVLVNLASLAYANGGNEVEEMAAFKKIIAPLGIGTLLAVITTITLGLQLKKNRTRILPWHKALAITTLLLALTHATMVLIYH